MSGDLVGTTVGGKYLVRSKIGTGSMGDVYEAACGEQDVALKVLRVDDDTLAARFLREAKTMSLFQHPNIVELLEVGKLDDGKLFFAAELVRGVTLRDLLDGGPIDTKRALAIVRQILDALGHAHAMGVVHRDIKPENVMLADGGSPDGKSDMVKILDFGVAKLIGDTPAVLGEGTLTITGYGALGTPYYISPEAVLGRPLDARADIYSIGAMLFELLTGSPPYAHEDVAVLMRMHAAAPIPTLKERAPERDVTPEIELVVSEALAKKPELRFKSTAEMVAAVDAALSSLDNPFFDEPAPIKKTTDVFGSAPMKGPASVDPSASKPAAFSPASIPSASQPVQPEPFQHTAPPTRKSRHLPGVAPYQTPVAGTPMITATPPGGAMIPTRAATDPAGGPGTAATVNVPAQGHHGGPVIGHVSPAQGGYSPPVFSPQTHGGMFSPPMPPSNPAPNKWLALAKQHKKYIAAGGGLLLVIIIIAIVASGGDDKPKQTDDKTVAKKKKPTKKSNDDLVKTAQEQLAAGHPGRAVELIEREEPTDDDEVWLVLGHARISSNRRLDGLAAYERAIELDKKHAADASIRANLERVLETRDVAAGIVALELATRLDPPATDLVKQAAVGKVADVRKRAFAIAEREKFADGIDRVETWMLDLGQAQNCEDRLSAVLKLKRAADSRAIPALKRAKTHRCVEREAAEAIAHLESQPAPAPQ